MKTKLLFILILFSQISFAQGSQTIDDRFRFVRNYNKLEVSYFEVNNEMFKTLAASEKVNSEFKTYISQLSSLKVVQSKNGELHRNFKTNCDLRKYDKLLMKQDENGLLSFYKKETKDHPNEFLLISDKMVIYIIGEIDLKSISEFEKVMQIAGSAFEL